MWTPQYIRYTLIGHSQLPLVVYLMIYICSLIIYEYGFHDSCEKDDDESKEVSKNDNFFWLKFLKNSIRIPRSSDGLDNKLGKAEFPTEILIKIFPEFWLKIHLMGWLSAEILMKFIEESHKNCVVI